MINKKSVEFLSYEVDHFFFLILWRFWIFSCIIDDYEFMYELLYLHQTFTDHMFG